MPRNKQGSKAGRAERNRRYQENLRARKQLRKARREQHSPSPRSGARFVEAALVESPVEGLARVMADVFAGEPESDLDWELGGPGPHPSAQITFGEIPPTSRQAKIDRLEKLTVSQLREQCHSAGITFTTRTRKADLIDKLVA